MTRKQGVPKEIGKYKVLFRLAAGGMAELFLARQRGIMGFERFVVIKRVLPHLVGNQHLRMMLLDEARISARLNHPNIIQVHELEELDGAYCIIMEYLEGQSLSAVLRESSLHGAALPMAMAVAITIQVSGGLHYAHEATDPENKPMNLVHRDISPQNLFVMYSGVVKVVDFGVAYADQKLVETVTGTIKGKYIYMSPEQLNARTLDRRSDIFSLGVVLWESLTLRKLFHAETLQQAVDAINSSEILHPSSIRPGIPKAFDQVVLRALQTDPRERFQTAAEFQQALIAAADSSRMPVGPEVIASVMKNLFAEKIVRHHELVQAAERGEPGNAAPEVLDAATGGTEPSLGDGILRPTRTINASEPLPARPFRLPTGLVLGTILATACLVGLWFLVPRGAGTTDVEIGTTDSGVAAKIMAAEIEEPSGAAMEIQDRHPVRQKKSIQPRKITIAPRPTKKGRQMVFGFLRLDSDPWTMVYLGEKKLGPTPLSRIELPPGKHTLRLVNAEEGIDQAIEVEIRSRELTSRKIRF